MSTEIVKSISIENMLNQRAAVSALVEKSIATLNEAHNLARQGNMGFPDVTVSFGGRGGYGESLCGDSFGKRRDALFANWLKNVDAGAWGHLMKESGLRSLMDSAARTAWDEKVFSGDVPPLTFENINATFTALHDSRGDMFERGVLACFRSLSWDYKTNSPFKFTKRIIIDNLFSCYGSGADRWLSSNSRSINQLDDLDRCFHILDGKPEPDHRTGWHSRLTTANRERFAEGSYFDIKWFLKGSGHLLFKRLDLVDKMNAILTKHHPNAIAQDNR